MEACETGLRTLSVSLLRAGDWPRGKGWPLGWRGWPRWSAGGLRACGQFGSLCRAANWALTSRATNTFNASTL